MATMLPSSPRSADATSDRSFPPIGALAGLATGAKLFLILSAALLPLALIAMVATLKTTATGVSRRSEPARTISLCASS